jgi:hypothetical protein
VRAVEIVIPWPPSVPSVNAVIAAPVPRLLGYPGSFALAARPVPRHVSGAVHVPSQVVVVRHCQRFRTCRVSCPPKKRALIVAGLIGARCRRPGGIALSSCVLNPALTPFRRCSALWHTTKSRLFHRRQWPKWRWSDAPPRRYSTGVFARPFPRIGPVGRLVGEPPVGSKVIS